MGEAADEIMEQLRAKQKEMRDCLHDTVTREDDEWHCNDCGLAFVERDSGLEDRLPEIVREGCTVKMSYSDDRSRWGILSQVLDHVGIPNDRRYTNSGGTFSRRGLEKLEYKLRDFDANNSGGDE